MLSRTLEERSLMAAINTYPNEETPRLVLADYWQEQGRDDVAAMWRGTLPERKDTRARIDTLTDSERAVFPAWVEQWVRIGLSTEPADRPLFEAAVTQCYIAAKLNPPRVVWCPSPLIAVLAGSKYAQLVASGGAVGDAVRDAVRGAVDGAVGDAVRGAVDDAVRGAVDGAVRGAVGDAVRGAVDDAVRGAVDDAVRGAVDDAVRGAVGDETLNLYWRHIGGQFWVGGWWWGPAYSLFMFDVLRLKLPDHLELAARAYAATASSACWWWPHRDVVFVSERPHTIEIRPKRNPRVLWEGWGINEEKPQ